MTDPAAARRALATIETRPGRRWSRCGVCSECCAVRATQPEELAPAPGLGELDALVADIEMSGVDVELCVVGERPNVPASVDLCAYRIVQEALTNVIKHAGPARATVAVRYSDHE